MEASKFLCSSYDQKWNGEYYTLEFAYGSFMLLFL